MGDEMIPPWPGYLASSMLVLGLAAVQTLVSVWWVRRAKRLACGAESGWRLLAEAPAILCALASLAICGLWYLSYFQTDYLLVTDSIDGGLVVAQYDGTMLAASTPYRVLLDLKGPYGSESPMWYSAFADYEPIGNKDGWFGYMYIDTGRPVPDVEVFQALVLPHWALLLLAAILPSVRLLSGVIARSRDENNL